MALSKAQLSKLNKEDIVTYALGLQDKLINRISALETSFEESIEKISSELVIAKHVNTKLQEKIVTLEKKAWENEQYSRRECLEITGIPETVQNECLEDKVCEILKTIDIDIDSRQIEACHRIKNNRTILKLSHRKDAVMILSKRKNLKNSDFSELDLGENPSIFINESLCGYYKGLWNKCRDLKKANKIHGFWIANGKIKYRIVEKGITYTVTHDNDLEHMMIEA